MAADFVHLHLHTHYSLLDGACTPEGLIKMAKEYDMPAVAITDHGFMGGALDVYKKFKEAKINPIIGCEAYVAPGSRTDRNPAVPFIRGHHLVLLAKDISGYHSLCKLIEEACRTGIYYKPRIDKELLAAHHDGLIVMSACIGGEIPAAIIDGDMAKAERAIGEYCDIVGKENFYLEIMDHGIEEERTANRGLIELSKKMNLPLIATNDVHYLKKEHARAHEIMLCIQTQSKLDDTKRMKFDGDEFYFKSPDEMKALFKEVPEAITNTVELAERCNIEFKFAPKVNHYPVFKVENFEGSNKDFLRKICVDNIDKLYSGDADRSREEIIKRLDFELGVIEKTGFLDYFLVVADFISYARQQNIPVGPGRGSGAGSLVAYLSRITDIEPLKYNLLFERFLNPERISPPDFDIDFCEKRRSEVIDYVRMKYGSDSVCQIGTYGKLKAKAVIKDVARVLGHPYDVGDRITKLIPNDPKMTLAKARKESPELAEMLKNDPTVQEIFSYAEILEGLNRQMGIHAAGVIIGDQPLDELVPLSRGADGEVITQFPAVPCESLGLLKMDFLGLRTLTIIQNACDLIKKSRGIEIDISKILLDDQKTYDLLNRGDTISVFQLESSGMQNLCRQFGVETIEHIIALIAIYRPGPMEFIPEFVACKRGTKPVEYDHPKMEKILKETYGIMLYQEQIMQVVQELAGFTLGGADILRRAIGKKDVKVLEGERAKFIAGCAEHNQIPYQKAEAIWEKIGKFAGYGFNKSHSAAYAFVAYRTAWLKANYPVEFMAAVLTSELANAEKIAFIISECREMGIKVLSPDVNSSDIDFSVDNDSIRFGLGAIKGVGSSAAGKIVESVRKDGKFKNFTDFCERCSSSVNSRMLECLTRAGAFDCFGLRRSQILAISEETIRFAQARVRDRLSGQGSLFDLLDDSEQEEMQTVAIPDIPEFSHAEMLHSEKELLGFYISGHPMSEYLELSKAFSTVKIGQLNEINDNCGVRLAAFIKTCRFMVSRKSGKPYAILELEDIAGNSIECMIYSKTLEEIKVQGINLNNEMPIFIEALTSKREEERAKLFAEKVVQVENVYNEYTDELFLYISEDDKYVDKLRKLHQICSASPGNIPVIFGVNAQSGESIFVETTVKISLDEKIIKSIRECLGANGYRIRPNDHVPSPRAQNGQYKRNKPPES